MENEHGFVTSGQSPTQPETATESGHDRPIQPETAQDNQRQPYAANVKRTQTTATGNRKSGAATGSHRQIRRPQIAADSPLQPPPTIDRHRQLHAAAGTVPETATGTCQRQLAIC